MRSDPDVSRRSALGVSRQRVRRPTRSAVSQPSAAVRMSACLVAFSSTPRRLIASMIAAVQTVPPADSTYSPRIVKIRPRALEDPAACRRGITAGRAEPSASGYGCARTDIGLSGPELGALDAMLRLIILRLSDVDMI